MKKNILLFIGLFFITATNIQAQVSVNVNLGTPPVWAPADRVETQYYYLPDIDTYYDVPSERFIYISNGKWIRSTVLPVRYKSYNLNSGRVVYLTDYRGKSPYVYHKKHKVKYVTTSYKQPKKVVIVNGNGNKHKGHKKDKKHKD